MVPFAQVLSNLPPQNVLHAVGNLQIPFSPPSVPALQELVAGPVSRLRWICAGFEIFDAGFVPVCLVQGTTLVENNPKFCWERGPQSGLFRQAAC